MKILQLTKKFPYPPHDGEAIAILCLTKAFADLGHEVSVLALNTSKHHYRIENLPDEVRATANWQSVDINTSIQPVKAFLNLFSSQSYNIERFYSPEFEKLLAHLLTTNNYDVIQLETLYMSQYIDVIKSNTRAPVVLRSHNLEFEIWERRAINESNFFKNRYLNLLSKRLKNFEVEMLGAYDAIVPITERDKQHYERLGEVPAMHVCPVGAQPEPFNFDQVEFPSVFFLGGLDWAPNQDGLQWFLHKVWPKVSQQHPNCKFYIAGRNAPKNLLSENIANVKVLGEIDDAAKFMRTKSVMVVPLFSGSGMRVKIIGGLNLGKAIVTTSLGAEGIDAEDGHDMILADTPDDFIAAIVELLNDRSKVELLGRNGANFVRENFDLKRIAQDLINFYKAEFEV